MIPTLSQNESHMSDGHTGTLCSKLSHPLATGQPRTQMRMSCWAFCSYSSAAVGNETGNPCRRSTTSCGPGCHVASPAHVASAWTANTGVSDDTPPVSSDTQRRMPMVRYVFPRRATGLTVCVSASAAHRSPHRSMRGKRNTYVLVRYIKLCCTRSHSNRFPSSLLAESCAQSVCDPRFQSAHAWTGPSPCRRPCPRRRLLNLDFDGQALCRWHPAG